MIVVCPIAIQASNVQYDPIQKSAYFKCNGCYTHKKILPDADHSKNISETKPRGVVAAKPQHEEIRISIIHFTIKRIFVETSYGHEQSAFTISHR